MLTEEWRKYGPKTKRKNCPLGVDFELAVGAPSYRKRRPK